MEARKKALIRPLQIEAENLKKRLIQEEAKRKERLVRERVDRITNTIKKTW